MSERNQIAYTICVQTADAEQPVEGTFVFRMPADAPRLKAAKISLGSLEFPMVQWNVEDTSNRFYFNEGMDMRHDCNTLEFRIFDLTTSEDAGTPRQLILAVPPQLNPILHWHRDGDTMVATCEHPHHLWNQDGSCMLRMMDWFGVGGSIVACPFGFVSLLAATRTNDLVPVSANAFAINTRVLGKYDGDPASIRAPLAGTLHVPSPPSPFALCQLLTRAAASVLRGLGLSLSISYNNRENIVDLSGRATLTSKRLVISRTSLSAALGFGAFERHQTLRLGETTRIRTESLSWWEAVELQAGCYGPCSRPACLGATRRLCAELEWSLNRLLFPVPDRIPPGSNTGYFIVFTDPSGFVCNCPIAIGRHDPQTLCRTIEDGMTRAAADSTPGVSFAVSYEDDRFLFACELVRDGIILSVPFSLLFNHPLQLDPQHLGFEAIVYSGSSSYVSPQRAHCANLDPRGEGFQKNPRNLYSFTEVANERRFRFHATSLPTLFCIIDDYDEQQSILTLSTFMSRLPYAHGLHHGDVVTVSSCRAGPVIALKDGEVTERDVAACNLSPEYGRMALVIAGTDDDVTVLRLRTRAAPGIASCRGQAISVCAQVAPFNFCLGSSLPKSLKETVLGFPRGATQWGLDGSTANIDDSARLPPYLAPAVFNLEHPDYVLIYFDTGNRSVTLQHAAGANVTTPFTKLVLYPMFREERMIPRDTMMISGESLTRFTLRFTNPDGSAYRFHGAQFSLSLNLIKVGDM